MPDDGRSRLGRGLAALIGDVGEETKKTERARSQRRVPVEFLRPNPRNPRRDFSDGDLDDLASSLRERGVIQPIVVRPVRGSADRFEIIAGERRWRAAQRAGLHDVPIVSVDVTDDEALQLAIIENVQRTDLNALEEAAGYQALINDFGHSHDEIAKTVGKSRVHITNTLRLLKLPDAVQAHLRAGKLTAGHARVLIGLPDAARMADHIIAQGLNVRQAEAWARAGGKIAAPTSAKGAPGKSADTVALEKRLSDVLGLRISIDHRGEAGAIHIHYRKLDQLDEVIRRLERKA
jgi:ParB family chromosome partitioning protein